MDAVHREGIQPGSVRQGPRSREGALGDLDGEECVNEPWMGQMVSERNRGAGGRLQVRAETWNKLSSATVQNGTLLAPTDRQRANNPSFVSGTGRRQSLSLSH